MPPTPCHKDKPTMNRTLGDPATCASVCPGLQGSWVGMWCEHRGLGPPLWGRLSWGSGLLGQRLRDQKRGIPGEQGGAGGCRPLAPECPSKEVPCQVQREIKSHDHLSSILGLMRTSVCCLRESLLKFPPLPSDSFSVFSFVFLTCSPAGQASPRPGPVTMTVASPSHASCSRIPPQSK